MRTISFVSLLLFILTSVKAQILKPGFDKEEYKELMYISARTTASEDYFKQFPEPKSFKMLYQSQAMGLDNLWDLWQNDKKVSVISLRGTTEKQESWLANFYAAMVPARGELEISNNNKFKYNLASHPNAAVHVGWLFATAFLSADIIPRIEELYSQQNVKDFIILGHSQGGAIAFLLTAHLYSLQKSGALPLDIRFKTYCSAAPKPGNLFFAYEYEALTQNGWAYNVVSSADWVPQTPISIQTLSDFNPTNPFINAKSAIKEQKFPARIVFKKVYKNLDKPTRKAQKNYEKYLGKMAGKIIKNSFEEYKAPQYYSSNDYVRTGLTIVLHSDEEYFKIYPDSNEDIFIHHLHAPYLYLLDKLKMD